MAQGSDLGHKEGLDHLVHIMENQEKQESVSPGPVLSRLDRLDRALQLLEEKHSLSGRHLCKATQQKVQEEEEDQCKTLSTALEEVQQKGTLMDRLTVLENRVLQLSLQMDERNTSKSSSSTVPGSEKFDPSFVSSGERMDENVLISSPQGKKTSVAVKVQEDHHNSRKQSKQGYKKWLGRLRLGC